MTKTDSSFFDVTDKAMKHFGSDAQIDKLIEELGELSKALTKYKECGPVALSHVAEEIADVNMIIVPIQRELNIVGYTTEWTNAKLKRLNEILGCRGTIKGYD
jgi:NTP pyrophosphatase (non-canonical NTP hydrolase)